MLTVKDMITGEQHLIKPSELAVWIGNR
jgi:hypothetical protein